VDTHDTERGVQTASGGLDDYAIAGLVAEDAPIDA
jgi:hypothetical protein